MSMPLEGIKVLDLTRLLPGPFCTMVLADMGADVLRIQEADPRYGGRHVILKGQDLSPEEAARLADVYRVPFRNKKAIALNLKDERARQVFYKLAKDADVVVEEFRPGVTKRLGVDYDTLKKINPRLIYCAISGYGQDGPYAQLPGHDPCYIGMAGLQGITGTAAGEHVLPGIPIGDLAGGGWQGAVGILCALMARQKTGRGQFVDISMSEGVVLMLAVRWGGQYFATGEQPRIGDRPSHVYRCKDGKFIVIAPGEPWFWERICKVLGLDQYIPYHEHIMPFPLGGPKKQEIIGALAERFRTRTRAEWFRLLAEADTTAAPVYDFDEVFSDAHMRHRQMVLEVEHPRLGKVKTVGIAPRLSDTPGKVRSLGAVHGQHTDEVLRGLGYTPGEIEALRKAGSVK